MWKPLPQRVYLMATWTFQKSRIINMLLFLDYENEDEDEQDL
jgi:hypothetical protein